MDRVARFLADHRNNEDILLAEGVEDKLRMFVGGGVASLHVITDFDMTITKYWVDGVRNISAHGMFGFYSKASANFVEQIDQLVAKYYPIETDVHLTPAEKTPYMIEWWQKSHELITQMHLHQSDLEKLAIEKDVPLRPGFKEFTEICATHNIPILVFSAGIADMIEQILAVHGVMRMPLLHVISNSMLFDEDGYQKGFEDPIIHSFNKNEFTGLFHPHSMKNNIPVSTTLMAPLDSGGRKLVKRSLTEGNAKYQTRIRDKSNVLLMGDSLGDSKMVDDEAHGGVVLRIGFMNRFKRHNGNWMRIKEGGILNAANVDGEKESKDYLKMFDIVLCGDMDFHTFVNQLMLLF